MFINLPKKRTWEQEGRQGQGDGMGQERGRALTNDGDGCTLVGEDAGSRGMPKNGPKKRK